jgi:hypothetical protein
MLNVRNKLLVLSVIMPDVIMMNVVSPYLFSRLLLISTIKAQINYVDIDWQAAYKLMTMSYEKSRSNP